MPNPQDFGVMIGQVSDLSDPDAIGRVKVKYPNLAGKESEWARLAAPMAGKGRGAFFRPEVGDEVLVVFEQGDQRRPLILGSLWSAVDNPPPDDGNAAQNNWRFIQSRSGHLIKLDDTNGAERIELVGKGGQQKVVIDVAGQKIQVNCDAGDVEVTAGAGSVTISATKVEVKSSGDMNLEATGQMNIKGSVVNIN